MFNFEKGKLSFVLLAAFVLRMNSRRWHHLVRFVLKMDSHADEDDGMAPLVGVYSCAGIRTQN